MREELRAFQVNVVSTPRGDAEPTALDAFRERDSLIQ